jgi:hypothetical protein
MSLPVCPSVFIRFAVAMEPGTSPEAVHKLHVPMGGSRGRESPSARRPRFDRLLPVADIPGGRAVPATKPVLSVVSNDGQSGESSLSSA